MKLEQPFAGGQWMMGGSKDAAANAAFGVEESEVALWAVEAYGDALTKVGPGSGDWWRARLAWELVTQFEDQLHEGMGLDLYADDREGRPT